MNGVQRCIVEDLPVLLCKGAKSVERLLRGRCESCYVLYTIGMVVTLLGLALLNLSGFGVIFASSFLCEFLWAALGVVGYDCLKVGKNVYYLARVEEGRCYFLSKSFQKFSLTDICRDTSILLSSVAGVVRGKSLLPSLLEICFKNTVVFKPMLDFASKVSVDLG